VLNNCIITSFIDIPTILALVIPLVAILTATNSFKVFGMGLLAAISPGRAISEDIRGRAATLFRFMSKTTALTSSVIFIICLITLFNEINFADPGAIRALGGNISASLYVLFYGMILIASVFEPVVFVMKKRSR